MFNNLRQRLYFFLVCNHLAEEERAGCFTLSSCCYVAVFFVFLMVPWVGLQYVHYYGISSGHIFLYCSEIRFSRMEIFSFCDVWVTI